MSTHDYDEVFNELAASLGEVLPDCVDRWCDNHDEEAVVFGIVRAFSLHIIAAYDALELERDDAMGITPRTNHLAIEIMKVLERTKNGTR